MGKDIQEDLRWALERSNSARGGFFLYIYSKSEKLLTAIYLVTGLFEKGEPMRNRLRERGIDLLNSVFSIKDITLERETLENIATVATELSSLVGVSISTGIISKMNGELIKAELENLVKTIDDELTKVSEYGRLPKSIFEMRGGSLLESLASSRSREESLSDTPSKSLLGSKEKRTKDTHGPGHSKGQDAKRHEVSDRNKRILDMVKKSGPVTVSEVAEVITDCSGKTIQRTLISLMNSGKVERIGERRWAKYSAV